MRSFAKTPTAILIAGLLLFCPAAQAVDDDFADFRKELAREMEGFWGEQESALQEFRDERDRLFAEFLDEQWKEFEAFGALVADRTPKPRKLPKASTHPQDAVKPAGQIIVPPPSVPRPEPEEPVAPKERPLPPPAAPIVPEITPPTAPPDAPLPPRELPDSLPTPVLSPLAPAPGSIIEVDFFSRTLFVPFDPDLTIHSPARPDHQDISAFWQQAAAAAFEPSVDYLQRLRQELRLNDWGYYQLLKEVAHRAHPTSPNDQVLLSWFLLTKSGYRAKVGIGDGRVVLLLPAAQTLFGIPYFSIDDTRYFNVSFVEGGKNPASIATYPENYPGADHAIGLLLEQPPVMRPDFGTRQLSFRYGGQTHSVPVRYNRNTVRFLEKYPQTDFPVFFAAAIAAETDSSLVDSLAPLIAGKSETEAVNLLLRFVQTAFAYQTDEEQFAREKYLFVEETVHFPYSDCEDRSFLFGYLVRRLTGLEVVGLHFPGHLATAVRFTEEVAGDSVLLGGKKYIVCDPTYVNADIGMTMPQFQGVKPAVVAVGSQALAEGK